MPELRHSPTTQPLNTCRHWRNVEVEWWSEGFLTKLSRSSTRAPGLGTSLPLGILLKCRAHSRISGPSFLISSRSCPCFVPEVSGSVLLKGIQRQTASALSGSSYKCILSGAHSRSMRTETGFSWIANCFSALFVCLLLLCFPLSHQTPPGLYNINSSSCSGQVLVKLGSGQVGKSLISPRSPSNPAGSWPSSVSPRRLQTVPCALFAKGNVAELMMMQEPSER